MKKIIHHPVFFTATIRHWKRLLKPQKYKEIILDQLREQIKWNQLIVYSYCIMDNHIHIIWQVKGDTKPSELQKKFLEVCSKRIKSDLEVNHPRVLELFKSRQKDRRYHFWKRCALSIELYNGSIFQQKLNYIHNNPVAAGICDQPEKYLYSSAFYYETGVDKTNILTHYNG